MTEYIHVKHIQKALYEIRDDVGGAVVYKFVQAILNSIGDDVDKLTCTLVDAASPRHPLTGEKL